MHLISIIYTPTKQELFADSGLSGLIWPFLMFIYLETWACVQWFIRSFLHVSHRSNQRSRGHWNSYMTTLQRPTLTCALTANRKHAKYTKLETGSSSESAERTKENNNASFRQTRLQIARERSWEPLTLWGVTGARNSRALKMINTFLNWILQLPGHWGGDANTGWCVLCFLATLKIPH